MRYRFVGRALALYEGEEGDVASDGARRTQGVRPEHPVTVQQIVAAAIAIIDAGGVEGVSMRAVAERLGVTKTAINWHVPTRQRLLELVGSAWLAAVVPPPVKGDWTVWLRALAHAYRQAAHRQPKLAALAVLGLGSGQALTIPNALLERLEECGLPPAERVDAYNMVLGATIGFVHLELSRVGDLSWIATIDPEIVPALARNIDSLAGHAFGLSTVSEPLDSSFDYLVEVVVSGVASRCANPPT